MQVVAQAVAEAARVVAQAMAAEGTDNKDRIQNGVPKTGETIMQ